VIQLASTGTSVFESHGKVFDDIVRLQRYACVAQSRREHAIQEPSPAA
jgi:hypothetical protein